MWFWIWFANGGTINMYKALLWAAGAFALLGALLLTFSNTRSNWHESSAMVLSVRDGCALSSSSARPGRSTRVVIACDQIEQFKSNNPEENWSLQRFQEGRIRLTGGGPETVVEMGLNGYFGVNPRIGDQIKVLRDPASPEQIATVDWQSHVAIPGYLFLGLSGLLGAIAFAWF